MFSVRAGYFIPRGCGFRQYNDLCAFFVFPEDFIFCSGTGAQAQRITGCTDLVYPCGTLRRCGYIDLRRHGSRYRRTDDTALHQTLPFLRIIQRMNQRQFIFAVQRFCDRTGRRRNRTNAVGREISAIGGIDTDRDESPPSGHEKNAHR